MRSRRSVGVPDRSHLSTTWRVTPIAFATSLLVSASVAIARRPAGFAGRLFESMAIRGLQVYARANRCSLSHYRGSDNLEVDLIIQQPDGAWAGDHVLKLGRSAPSRSGHDLRSINSRDGMDGMQGVD